MLKSRVLSGIIGAVLLIGVVCSGTVPLRIAVGLVSALMVFELFRAVGLRSSLLLIPAAIFAAGLGSDVIPSNLKETLICIFILFILFVLLLRHDKIHITDVALAFLFTCFIGCFMGCITKIRMSPGGEYWIWLIFIGAWVSDIFAYFSGKLFGKKKLIPAVSPKKTVAGAVGGAVGAALGFLIFGLFVQDPMGGVNLLGLFAAGFIIAVFGQIGDLVASVIKRQYGIKDYGKIMPGHGGAMDRFDSILFVAPAIYFYMQLVL